MAAHKWIETGEVDKKGEPIRKPNPVHLDAGAGRAILDSIRWRLARMTSPRRNRPIGLPVFGCFLGLFIGHVAHLVGVKLDHVGRRLDRLAKPLGRVGADRRVFDLVLHVDS